MGSSVSYPECIYRTCTFVERHPNHFTIRHLRLDRVPPYTQESETLVVERLMGFRFFKPGSNLHTVGPECHPGCHSLVISTMDRPSIDRCGKLLCSVDTFYMDVCPSHVDRDAIPW